MISREIVRLPANDELVKVDGRRETEKRGSRRQSAKLIESRTCWWQAMQVVVRFWKA